MNITAQERIQELQMYLCIPFNAIAKKIGVSQQMFYDIKSGKTQKLSENLINKICKEWPEINYNFLANGTGKISDSPIQYSSPEPAKRIVNSDLVSIIKSQQEQIKELTKQIMLLSAQIAELSKK